MGGGDTQGLASASRLDGDDESGTWGRGKSGRPWLGPKAMGGGLLSRR
jgi:hypothetical protein